MNLRERAIGARRAEDQRKQTEQALRESRARDAFIIKLRSMLYIKGVVPVTRNDAHALYAGGLEAEIDGLKFSCRIEPKSEDYPDSSEVFVLVFSKCPDCDGAQIVPIEDLADLGSEIQEPANHHECGEPIRF